jgi:hypothetical protein
VAIAERRVEHAEDYVQRTRQRTTPAIARYDQAVAERDRLRADLLHHRSLEELSANQVRVVQRRVDASTCGSAGPRDNPWPSNDFAK